MAVTYALPLGAAGLPPVTLRDYQEAAVDAIRATFGKFRRVLFVLPTGGGKTIIFSFIGREAARKGKRVIILAHRRRIVSQISKALARLGVEHGLILPGRPMTECPVQVAMVQTLANRLDRLEEPDLLIIDEAHHGVAGTWERVCARWTAARQLGVTATPERLDGRGLKTAFDTLVIGPYPRDLIAAGALSEYDYLAPPNNLDLSGVHVRGGDYAVDELADAMLASTITGDAVEHYARHLDGRPAIAFCVNVEHAKATARAFQAAGWRAASVDGSMPDAVVADLIDALGDGRLNVLTSCELISEGVDVPNVGGCILLRPTKSLALWLQQVGRALRPNEDGSRSIILDHVGTCHQKGFGLPCLPRDWSLDGRKARARDAAVTTCKLCFRTLPASVVRGPDFECAGRDRQVCPYLEPGQPRELPTEVDGELVSVTGTPAAEPEPWRTRPAWAEGITLETAQGRDWYRLLDLAHTDTGRLEEIRKARGYKSGWVRYTLAARFEIDREVQEFLDGRRTVADLGTNALWPSIRAVQALPPTENRAAWVGLLKAEYAHRKLKAA